MESSIVGFGLIRISCKSKNYHTRSILKGMERIQTILELRSSQIIFPDSMLIDPTHKNTVEIIRWLLSHDPSLRPNAEELLALDLVPPAELEANELQEIMRHVLANPQSKTRKTRET